VVRVEMYEQFQANFETFGQKQVIPVEVNRSQALQTPLQVNLNTTCSR